MVKSETRRDTGILVRNLSPRLFGKKFRDRKSKNKPCKNETSRLIKNASEISRSCRNFPRPTFFVVPSATPQRACNYLEFQFLHQKSRCEMLIGRDDINNYPWQMFFNVCVHSRSFLLRTDWRKSDSSVEGEPQGN